MGFRDYYRQFDEMAPEEISQELLGSGTSAGAAR
jgi:hypothetical protein